MATQTSRQNRNSLLSEGSAIWFSAGRLREGAEVLMETRVSKYPGCKLRAENLCDQSFQWEHWQGWKVLLIILCPWQFVCLCFAHGYCSTQGQAQSLVLFLSPQVIPGVYPNRFSFNSTTWIAHYLFRQRKLANSLTSHFTDILPHISPLILSCFTSLSLSFAFCLLCHLEESIRNWWKVTDFQACLPALAHGWNCHDAAFLPCVCASCFP